MTKPEELIWEPMPGKVVIAIQGIDEKQVGHIILMGKKAEEMNVGTVVAVPADAVVDGQQIAPYVQVGQRVVFGKYAGTELSVSNDRTTRYVVMREVDILTIVRSSAEVEEVPPGPEIDVAGPEPEEMEGGIEIPT